MRGTVPAAGRVESSSWNRSARWCVPNTLSAASFAQFYEFADLDEPANVLQRDDDVKDIVNLAAVATIDAQDDAS